MGIEQIFNKLLKINTFKDNSIFLNVNKKLNCNYIYIDFNSIIYNVLLQIEDELNYALYELILHIYQLHKIDDKTQSILKKINYKLIADKTLLLDDYITFLSKIQNDYIINNIKIYLDNLINNFFHQNYIKKIYVAFDGLPTMSKIIEQKKRRYNGYILNGLKNKILQDENSKLSKERIIFEKYRYSFSRLHLIPDSIFMQSLYSKLLDPKYIISGPNENGEGEKKIMEDIILHKNEGDYCIYSPDGDTIILSTIIYSILSHNNITSTFKLLRFDQQSNAFNLIDINIFLDNIYKYVVNMLTININKIFIFLDISYIYSLFGNDFVPRIEAIYIQRDLLLLIDIYCEIVNSAGYGLIYLDNKTNKYSINISLFILFINKLSLRENNMLRDKYILNNYKINSNIFDNNIYEKLLIYTELANILYEYVDNIKKNNLTVDKILINTIIKKLESKANNYNIKLFIDNFIKLETYFKNYSHINIYQTIEYIITILITKNNYPSLNLHKIIHKINNKYIPLAHPKMDITTYDIQCNLLEKKQERYKKMLNADDIYVGKVSFFIENNRYIMISNDIEQSTKKYYKSLFHANITDIVKEYLLGLFWVFDFYINKNNKIENSQKISSWFYPHHYSPLITSINSYLQSEKFILDKLNLMLDFTKYDIDKSKYMTIFEHKLYITPVNKLIVPDKYTKLLTNKQLFPDLQIIINQIWEGNGHKYINCKNIIFTSKCNLLINNMSFNDFMKYLYKIR